MGEGEFLLFVLDQSKIIVVIAIFWKIFTFQYDEYWCIIICYFVLFHYCLVENINVLRRKYALFYINFHAIIPTDFKLWKSSILHNRGKTAIHYFFHIVKSAIFKTNVPDLQQCLPIKKICNHNMFRISVYGAVIHPNKKSDIEML